MAGVILDVPTVPAGTAELYVRDDLPMRPIYKLAGPVGLGAGVLGLAALVLAKADREPEYWSVAWPGVLTRCGTLALALVTYLVLRGDQLDRRKREAQDERRIEHERRAQAARVQVYEPLKQLLGGMTNSYLDLGYQVEVANKSDDAIGECFLLTAIVPPSARRAAVDFPAAPVGRLVAGDTRV